MLGITSDNKWVTSEVGPCTAQVRTIAPCACCEKVHEDLTDMHVVAQFY